MKIQGKDVSEYESRTEKLKMRFDERFMEIIDALVSIGGWGTDREQVLGNILELALGDEQFMASHMRELGVSEENIQQIQSKFRSGRSFS